MHKRVWRLLLIVLIVLSTVACDQSTKHMARVSLRNRGTIPVIGDFFVLKYAENQGGFLSLGANWPYPLRFTVFTILSLAMIIGASFHVLRRSKMSLPQTVALSLIIGGGSGNLLDRLLRGGLVTDFMNLGIDKIRTGIFNLADLFLLAGVAIFIIVPIGHNPKQKTSPEGSRR